MLGLRFSLSNFLLPSSHFFLDLRHGSPSARRTPLAARFFFLFFFFLSGPIKKWQKVILFLFFFFVSVTFFLRFHSFVCPAMIHPRRLCVRMRSIRCAVLFCVALCTEVACFKKIGEGQGQSQKWGPGAEREHDVLSNSPRNLREPKESHLPPATGRSCLELDH